MLMKQKKSAKYEIPRSPGSTEAPFYNVKGVHDQATKIA